MLDWIGYKVSINFIVKSFQDCQNRDQSRTQTHNQMSQVNGTYGIVKNLLSTSQVPYRSQPNVNILGESVQCEEEFKSGWEICGAA